MASATDAFDQVVESKASIVDCAIGNSRSRQVVAYRIAQGICFFWREARTAIELVNQRREFGGAAVNGLAEKGAFVHR